MNLSLNQANFRMPCYGKQKGFTLVELLVGMMIGLIVVVVTGQILAVNENQKRTTTFGNDSMVNGNLALYTLERDGKNAGYGITSTPASLGCIVKAKYGANATTTYSLSPLLITDGADGTPDVVSFMASNKNGVSLPTKIAVDHPKTAANFFVESDIGISEGDLLLAIPQICDANNWASVIQVTGTGGNNNGGGQGQNQVQHNSGQSEWNQPGGQTIFPDAGYPVGSYLVNLGSFVSHIYSISNNNLQVSTLDSTTGTNTTSILYPQIIQLQAQYGKDTNNDGVVDTWNNVTPTTNADSQQVKALRIAIVARSNQWQKDQVTFNDENCPSTRSLCWAGGKISNINTGNPGVNDWKHYRHQLFETTIPLRNVIWKQ